MTISRVVVLDPGKTTGLVDWRADGSFEARQCDFKGTCSYLLNMAAGAMNDGSKSSTVLVSESFIIGPQTAKNTQAPWSLELIGVTRLVSEIYLGRELILQQPAAAKRFASDARLKRIGFWTPAQGHANDAARHLLLYLATHGLLSSELLHEFAEMP